MHAILRRSCAVILLFTATSSPALADATLYIPTIVVTPMYIPTTIERAGSTVTVIDSARIAESGAGSVAELLRTVPGVQVTESGGSGGRALVSLRGAEAQHTLVLIDGVRVNDPASARDEFDFSVFSPTDVERIEILRGPQSALYGSDAIGGVINIITKHPAKGMHGSLTAEAGSYGTRRTTATASGDSGPWSLMASGTYYATDGFSRVGDRDNGEQDSTLKYAGTLRGSYDAGEGRSVSFGLNGYHQDSLIDKSATVDASGYTSARDLIDGFARFTTPSHDGKLVHTLTVFGTSTTRDYVEPTRDTKYRGTNVGFEYQGTLKLGVAGSLLGGLRLERETAHQKVSTSASPAFDGGQTLYAGYLLYQLPVNERLNLSFAGRYDGASRGDGFLTGRFTAVYDMSEIETRIRGSFGSGAKRPTAFQLSYNPALEPETSLGADLGIEKTLLDGRLTVGVTGFWNRFENLINFDGDYLTGTYKNIDSAETAGVEATMTATIVPGVLSGTAAYTYLFSRDLSPGLPLQRRPKHSGALSLAWTGIENVELRATATLVGDSYNDDAATVPLGGWARVDLSARYAINPQLTAFGRIENLFNARYQEATGYNTAGISAYAGLTWRH